MNAELLYVFAALIMDETSIERQAAPDPVDVADGVNSPGTKQSESDYIYNDDFENADFNEESSSRSSSLTTTSVCHLSLADIVA